MMEERNGRKENYCLHRESIGIIILYNEKVCDCGLDLKLATERLRGVDGWFDDRICDVVTRYQNMGMDIRLFLQVSTISILLLCCITNRNKEPKSYFDTRP